MACKNPKCKCGPECKCQTDPDFNCGCKASSPSEIASQLRKLANNIDEAQNPSIIKVTKLIDNIIASVPSSKVANVPKKAGEDEDVKNLVDQLAMAVASLYPTEMADSVIVECQNELMNLVNSYTID